MFRPAEPYFFYAKGFEGIGQYEKGLKINSIFENSVLVW
jgi:hypothetical protein